MTSVRTLADAGVSVWLDDLGRHRIDSGELTRLIEDVGVVGVTTNPSIFAAAVRSGTDYEAQLADSAGRPEDVLHDLMVRDVQDACSLFSETFAATAARDGRVSLEVDPRLAFDTEATVAAARGVWNDVARPNVMVKIPATREGLPAITQTLAQGVSVNVTLIFGIQRYLEVQEAWASGLEAARAGGHDIASIGSVASFFVSRLDTAVDGRLDALHEAGSISDSSHTQLRGRAAVANARRAYRAFRQAMASDRWQQLLRDGAQPQRPLWASTSTKDPSFPVTRYVDELVATDTVNTMPSATLDAVIAAARTSTSAIDTGAEAEAADVALFAELAAVGIDYDEVVADLERAGVQSFIDSWNDLLELVAAARRRVAG